LITLIGFGDKAFKSKRYTVFGQAFSQRFAFLIKLFLKKFVSKQEFSAWNRDDKKGSKK
jgi:hypothetical protein